MNGEIISLMAQGAPAAARLDEPVLGPAPAADVARFADAMGSHAAPEVSLSRASAIEPGSFFDTLRNVGHQYSQHMDEIRSVMQKAPANIGAWDLMRLQVGMLDASIQVELVTRTVQRATQSVDQLSKLQ